MIISFDKVDTTKLELYGGKATALGWLTQHNFPAPKGFVISTDCFDNGLTIPTDKVYKMFDQLDSKFVAVRSSATLEDGKVDSFAGQFDTYLFVTRDQLIDKIEACQASVTSKRVVAYCEAKGIDVSKVKVAVVVQEMIDSEIAGVGFTLNPSNNKNQEILIEACYGQGEALVSGTITPDSYIVQKEPLRITNKSVSIQKEQLVQQKNGGGLTSKPVNKDKQELQKLPEDKLISLSKLLVQIENAYRRPVDVEWAIANNSIYITQVRPITGLPQHSSDKALNITGSNHIRMFEVPHMPYLISRIFLDYYKQLHVVITYKDNNWVSYLPKHQLEKTKEAGKKIYLSESNYSALLKNYETYRNNVSEQFKGIANEHLTPEHIKHLLGLLTKQFYYYSKTEFFYTDGLLEGLSTKDAENMHKKVDAIKTPGREFTNKLFFGEKSLLTSLLKQLSIQTKCDVELLNKHTPDELVELVKSGGVPKPEITMRHEDHMLHGKGTHIDHIDGEAAQELLTRFSSDNNSSTITGKCANPGVVKGKVRKIMSSYKNFDKLQAQIEVMKEGEILVAETTSPELIEACHKAAGIITNQGGLLSHAAIISRELNIPCIVGTGNATKLLSTGDTIYLDASSGRIEYS